MRFRLFVALLFIGCVLPAIAHAQAATEVAATQPITTPSSQPATAPTTQAAPTTAPAVPAVALAEINEQLDAAVKIIRSVESDLAPQAINPPYADELANLSQQLDAQKEEARSTLASQPTVEALRALSNTWQSASKPLWEWRRDLTARATRLDQHVIQLADLERHWADRLKQAQDSHAPEDVIKRVSGLLDSIRRTRASAEKGRSQIISLQNRASEKYSLTVEVLTDIKAAQDRAVGQLLERDAEPLWSRSVREQTPRDIVQNGQSSLSKQIEALTAYSARSRQIYFAHFGAAVLVVMMLLWVRVRVGAWVRAEPELAKAFDVFRYPVSTGLLLSALASIWIYTQAPRLLWVVLGTAMMAPAIYLLRQLLDRRFRPVLNGMAAFYVWDQVRTVFASLPTVARVLFVAEMVAGVLFVVWLVRQQQLKTIVATLSRPLQALIALLVRVAGTLFLAAFAANVFGYVGLGRLIGTGTLVSAYLGLIFFAAAEVLEGLLMAILRVWPFTQLKMIQRERELVHQRLSLVLRWAVYLFWAWMSLSLFAIREQVIVHARNIFTATLPLGPLQLSLWNLASFAFVIWASFALSRFVRFVLEEDVYPRLLLPRGLPYAFSMVFHYIVLLIGFFTAVGALGYDLTKFTILAGAFGVGLGFGLQNIVNNFVSGIILLFERPIKLGDTIEIDGLTGTVRQIGIRASVVRTTTGAELIVPNSRFISEKVTNWTFSTGQRAIRLSVNVSAQTDPHLVMDLLTKCAREVDLLTNDPAPQATLAGFAAGAMTFDLQAWTKRYEDWTAARSQLSIAVSAALKIAEIELK